MTPYWDAELSAVAARAAMSTHLQFHVIGASRRVSFEAAIGTWRACRPGDTRAEAEEAVVTLLIRAREIAAKTIVVDRL